MGGVQESLALLFTEAGGDEQHGGGTAEQGLVELQLVVDEVLI